MSQVDYNVANADGATVRADINAQLGAIATNNSGATAPTTTFANMWWFDTATNDLNQRNEANTAWVLVARKDGSGWTPYFQGVLLALANTTVPGIIETADQTEQEAGTATDRAVVPGRQHFHDSAAKAWANFSVAGSITDDFNVTSITDTAVGDWTVNLTTSFSSANYAAFSSGRADNASDNMAWGITTLGAGSYRVHSVLSTGAEADPASGNVWTVAFGDL